MKVKNSRTVLGPEGAHPSLLHALIVVDRVWRKHTGRHPRITGLAEEGHSEGSLHYGIPGDPRCRAFDVDAGELSKDQRLWINEELLTRLGDLEYDFVWESLGTPNAHLHLEVDVT